MATLIPGPVSLRIRRTPEEEWGVEDPRVTWVEDRDRWVIAYTAYSPNGPLVSLAETKDFARSIGFGAVMPPENKDAAVFPRRVSGTAMR